MTTDPVTSSRFAGPALSGTQSAALNESCMQCHDDLGAGQSYTTHSDCMVCHIDAAAHSDNPDLANPSLPASQQCLTCHDEDVRRRNWKFAEHHTAGVGCRDCHGIHAAKPLAKVDHSLARTEETTQLCATCHREVLARFEMNSSHPVKEGAMSCLSCHEPHGTTRTRLEGATAQCTRCHQSVRGPHVFEHVPAAEDCSNCHNPHGSTQRTLLSYAEPMLCLQCHSLPGNRHGQTGSANNTQRITGAMLRQCSSCHRQIHGSSQDQHLRY
ncbi:MAG TPA: cytochrome c3 family protein [Opitutaceae bacterium]